MALRKRLRRFTAVPSHRPVRASLGTLDIWLQRISHISQFGLFLFTVGAIYFTVIPLYQKALLDEQIARKELELVNLQNALDSAYVKIRFAVVGDYILHAGAQCSGLMIPPVSLRALQSNSSAKKASNSEQVLAIKPAECLSRELDKVALQELRARDLALLQSEVSRTSTKLEQFRQIALVRFSKAEETTKSRPHNMPTAGVAGAIAEYVLKGESPQFQESVLARIAVDKERSDAAGRYANEVRAEISSLRDIKWPSANSSGL